MGLLMNRLGIDATGRVVFDASDALVDDEDEEEEELEMEDQMVDVSQLREFIPTEEKAAELTISETLGSFQFSSNPDEMPDLATIMGLTNDEDVSREQSAPPVTGEAHDFFGDEDYDMGGGNYGGDDMSAVGGDDGDVDDVFGAPEASGSGTGHAPPRPGQDLFMAFVDGDDNDGMFDYFDRGFSKGWAGAEHWKLRKVSRKGECWRRGAGRRGELVEKGTNRRPRHGRRDQGEEGGQGAVHNRLYQRRGGAVDQGAVCTGHQVVDPAPFTEVIEEDGIGYAKGRMAPPRGHAL